MGVFQLKNKFKSIEYWQALVVVMLNKLAQNEEYRYAWWKSRLNLIESGDI